MSKIRIKNFGPIKEGYQENDGWMDVKKVTVFIGNQGSGKSTVAKLISTFTWIEKALARGDFKIDWISKKDILNQYLSYHRIKNYISNDKTFIEYKGEILEFKYEKGDFIVNETPNDKYNLPKIMYVPAERNLVAYLKNPDELRQSSYSMLDFITEFNNAKYKINKIMKLPLNEVEIELNNINDSINLIGKDYKIDLTEASSGFQSFIPLYLVSWFLAGSVKTPIKNNQELMTGKQRQRFRNQVRLINENDNLTDEQKRIALSEEANRINKSSFINIVEEPEQNLYPTSQSLILNSLLEFNNLVNENKLIISTHSPYLINYLTLAVKAGTLFEKITNKDLRKKLNNIVPFKSMIKPDDLAIYELDEIKGSIKELGVSKTGIPSDENLLNIKLSENNELFAQLLEIQQKS